MSVSLSTHVLDTEDGRPGSGVRVELYRGDKQVAAGETDGDEPGSYRLVFHPASPYFRRLELELNLTEGHHHVPLLVSSYSCTTYRGS